MAATFDGQSPGWIGHCRYTVSVTAADATTYDPPLRILRCVTDGTVVLVLDGDDAATTHSRAMVAGDEITNLAVKIVKTASTGTYVGFR